MRPAAAVAMGNNKTPVVSSEGVGGLRRWSASLKLRSERFRTQPAPRSALNPFAPDTRGPGEV